MMDLPDQLNCMRFNCMTIKNRFKPSGIFTIHSRDAWVTDILTSLEVPGSRQESFEKAEQLAQFLNDLCEEIKLEDTQEIGTEDKSK